MQGLNSSYHDVRIDTGLRSPEASHNVIRYLNIDMDSSMQQRDSKIVSMLKEKGVRKEFIKGGYSSPHQALVFQV
jgi:hypothetical protein